MNKSILIRADGNQNVGLGHLVRCISLAHMLKTDYKSITFICREVTPELEKEIYLSGFYLHKINNEAEFFDKIHKYSIVVLDGYSFSLQYQNKIKSSGAILVFIDDMHRQEFMADLIINQAPGVKETDYNASPITRFCLGPEYALLRPSFLYRTQNIKPAGPIEKIFICFGGSDPRNLTESTANYLVNDTQAKEIIVVAGSANKHIQQLKILESKHGKINLFIGLNESSIFNAMKQSDIAIIPASGILYEVLALNLIPISGYYMDNQKPIYQGFKDLNAFFDAKDFSVNNLERAYSKAKNAMERKHVNLATIIDGLSAERIKNNFLRL